jgi:hypothetical protein
MIEVVVAITENDGRNPLVTATRSRNDKPVITELDKYPHRYPL